MGRMQLTEEEKQASRLRRKAYLRRYYLEHREEISMYNREKYSLRTDKEARIRRCKKRKVLLDIWVSGDSIKIMYAQDTDRKINKVTVSLRGKIFNRSWDSVCCYYRGFSAQDRDRIEKVFEFVQCLIINQR